MTGEPHFADSYSVFQVDGAMDDGEPVLGQEFNPSLTGEDWQARQWAQVINYAFTMKNLVIFRVHHAHDNLFSIYYDSRATMTGEDTDEADIFTACGLALLGNAGRLDG